MAWVYILETDTGYYVGSTTDLERRFKQHQSKRHTHSTQRMGELKLVFSQEYTTIKMARKIEARLKKLKRKDYIERIIADGRITMRA